MPGLNTWPHKLPDKKKSVNNDDVKEIKDHVQIDKKDQSAEFFAEYTNKTKSVNDDDLTEIKERMPIHKKDQSVSQASHQSILQKNDSVAPTQLDMEEVHDAMAPDAKRSKSDMEPEHEDEGKLSVDEHTSLVQVLLSVLEVVQRHFQALCTTLIKDKNFDKLQHLTNHIECIESFVGSPLPDFTILRKEAHQVVTALVQFFAEFIELADAVVNLQGWQKLSSMTDNTMGQILQKLLKVWEEGWDDKKKCW